jgi:hypothetical protein
MTSLYESRSPMDWCQASTPREAIRQATLLPSRKPSAWLREAATAAEVKVGPTAES